MDFIPTLGSANAEMLTSFDVVRGRCRTLVKDFSTARGALRNEVNNVVGHDPFRLEMKVGSWSDDGKTFKLETKTNRMIQEAWVQAGKKQNCTVRRTMARSELYQCVTASVWRDGFALVRKHRGFDNKFLFALELIDGDRLQSNYMGKAPQSGNKIRFSIEYDKFNAPVAFWILTRHPGDLFDYNGDRPNTWRERVPAKDIILINNLRLRAEQDIGFPECDSVIQELHRSRQFDIAHVTAAIKNCVSGFFIKQDYPTGMVNPGDPAMDYGRGTGADGSGAVRQGDGKGGGVNKVEILEPGQMRVTNIGETPMVLATKFPNEAAKDFKKDILKSVAAGLGQSYAAVSGDFEGYSFSTARAGELPQRDNYMVRQDNIRDSLIEEYFAEWIQYAIMSGQLELPLSRVDEFCRAAHFHGKRWPYVNPMQDAQTDIMLKESLLKSPQEILSEGEGHRNVEDVIAEIAEFNRMATDAGLDPNPDAGRPVLPKEDPAVGATPVDDTPPAPAPKKGRKSAFGRNGHRVV